MKLKYLELYNIGPYKGKVGFDLNKSGIILLKGEQGSGKTTILNAITLALFNKIKKADKTILVKDIQNWYVSKSSGCYVMLLFEADGNIYKVVNSRSHPKYGTGYYLYKVESGRDILISDTDEDTKKEILSILRYDYNTFTNSSYIRQKAVVSLIGRPSERLSIFLNLLGYESAFNSMNTFLVNKVKEIEAEYNNIEGSISAYSRFVDCDINEIINKRVAVNIRMLDIRSKLYRLRQDELYFKRSVEYVANLVSEYMRLSDEMENCMSRINTAKRDIDAAKKNIENLNISKNTEINNIDRLKMEIDDLLSKKENTLKELSELFNVDDILRGYKAKYRSYSKALNTYIADADVIKEKIKEITSEKEKTVCSECGREYEPQMIAKMKRSRTRRINSLKADLVSVQEKIDKYDKLVMEYDSKIDEYEKLRNKKSLLEERLYDYERRLEKYPDTSLSVENILKRYEPKIKEEKTFIANNHKLIEETKSILKSLEKKADEIESKLSKYGDPDDILSNGPDKSMLDEIGVKIRNLSIKYNSLRDIGRSLYNEELRYKKAMAELEEILKKKDLILKRLQRYTFIKESFKNYRRYVADKFVGAINEYMNSFLDVFGFPYQASRFHISGKNLLWSFFNGNEWKDVSPLSGGEMQSLLLSAIFSFFKILSRDRVSNIMICDEPLAGLDVSHQESFFKFLESFRSEDTLVIISTHSAVVEDQYFDEIWEIKKEGRFSKVIM